MSLHHPTIVHGSGLNKSNDRRIGFVIQSYIASNVIVVLASLQESQPGQTSLKMGTQDWIIY